MKKVFLSFFLAASFYGASAQVQFGAKAGANLSTFTGDDVEDLKSKIGFNVGVFAEIPVTEKFSVKPEAVYSLQGAKADEGDGKLNFSYINVPVLAKYNIAESFFAETGPQIGFLVSAKAKDDDNSEDIKDFYKSTDFSWAFGLGYQFTESIGANLRYNLGLSTIVEDGDAKAKNSVFQLGLFYKFGGGSK